MNRYVIAALVLVSSAAACTEASQNTSTSTPTTMPEQGMSTTVAPTTTSVARSTTTIEIVSPLPEPTGDVIASGDGWDLTDVEFAALVEFAATTMQQSFIAPVAVELLGPRGVTDLRGDVEYISASQWDVMRALRLVGDDDSLEAVNEIRQERVRGTCCAVVDGVITVQVEDTGSEPLSSYVIVHELVHALLTQNPPSGVLPDTAFDEPVDVVSGASEGVPQWVAIRYHDSLATTEQEAIADDLPIIRPADLEAGLPPAAAELLTFGYIQGPRLVDGVDAAGVDRPYDQVVDRFPGSSEQVLFPDAYLAEENPLEPTVPTVPTGSVESGAGRLGTQYLKMLAASVVREEAALELVRPWGGDAYVLWNEDDGVCLSVDVTMDDPSTAASLASVLIEWSESQSEAAVASDGTSISITSCSD